MTIRSALCCALALAFAASAWGAGKGESAPPAKPAAHKHKAPPKTAPKKVAKAAPKAAPRTASKAVPKAAAKRAPHAATKTAVVTHKAIVKTSLKPAPSPVRAPAAVHAAPLALHGPRETLTCRDGTEDRHARIGVVLVGSHVESFAYYSKWKPRTCSIYLQRNRDGYSRWSDKGNVTTVSLERGQFLIEQEKGTYRFVFRDIDRERYCGMDGTINGTLTVRKGSERCELAGIMEEGTPLGQAFAQLETPPADVPTRAPVADAVASGPSEPAPGHGWFKLPKWLTFSAARDPSRLPSGAPSPFPATSVNIGD